MDKDKGEASNIPQPTQPQMPHNGTSPQVTVKPNPAHKQKTQKTLSDKNPTPKSQPKITTKTTPMANTLSPKPDPKPTFKHLVTSPNHAPIPTSSHTPPPAPIDPHNPPQPHPSQNDSLVEEFVPEIVVPEAEMEDRIEPEPKPPDLHSIDSVIMIEALNQYEERAGVQTGKDIVMVAEEGVNHPDLGDTQPQGQVAMQMLD
ncbi:hypothetical protein PIB30_027699 [Stylosanthes scabra]|uniref:Uncharacterized protein n=1 Tax=Stylosanthes scabra TaxID=79078 RepID=A0ABU6UDF5_9FABA|nr:hypothetical protein [Stylosanthes scabra]